MRAAIVSEWGQPPKLQDVPEPPKPDENQTQVRIKYVGVHQLVQSRAAGKHYSANTLPHLVGTDGVGKTPDGKWAYVNTMPGGSFAEVVTVPEEAVSPLSDEVDPAQIAAFFNPGMSSWMAIRARAKERPDKFHVAIMGVTSASGKTAISLMKQLGAIKITGMARNLKAMQELDLDERIVLEEDPTKTEFSRAEGADVILDYLYGPQTQQYLTTVKVTKPLIYVQVGTVTGPEISFPGATLRSKDLTMRGTGPGAYTIAELNKELPDLLAALTKAKKLPIRIEPLSKIDKVWGTKGERLVFDVEA